MNIIMINGTRINGGKRLKILVDERDVTPQDAQEIIIEVQGDIETIDVAHCKEIRVTGNVNEIECTSGNVHVSGNVTGDIETVSGDVKCLGNIEGDIDTTSGDVDCGGAVGGDVETLSGDISFKK